ncbi:response regulator [Candidatus Parcubacteria bacterium]|nr:response regulator [Candidatus Parcubacteria bacterium]
MKSILLIEDDPFLIDIYSTKLKELSFNVSVANNGDEVFEKLEEEEIELFILDIVLPNLDGWTILKKIKEIERFENIPVVILSNLGQRTDVEKGLKLGATKYLIKAHYTPSMVVEEIKKVLKKDE